MPAFHERHRLVVAPLERPPRADDEVRKPEGRIEGHHLAHIGLGFLLQVGGPERHGPLGTSG